MGALSFQHVTIIGLGLIGGSLAMAIKSCFPGIHLQAVDPQSDALQYALKAGVADEVSLTLPAHFADDHLIVLACHLTASLDVLRQLAPVVQGKNIIVSDIGSCKRQICMLGAKLLPTQFIGGHPMAGREKSGIQHGTSLLFAEKRYLLCPHPQTPQIALEKLEMLLQGIGAQVKQIDPDKHDRVMAFVSHFPQLYATILADLLKNNKPTLLMQYQGAGLDDQMRLAGSPHAMWGHVFEQNADNLLDVLTQFEQRIRDMRETLASFVVEQDNTALQEALKLAFANANEMYQTWLDFKQSPQTAAH